MVLLALLEHFFEIKVFWKKVDNMRNVQLKLDCDDIKMKARNHWNIAPFKQKCRYKKWDKNNFDFDKKADENLS